MSNEFEDQAKIPETQVARLTTIEDLKRYPDHEFLTLPPPQPYVRGKKMKKDSHKEYRAHHNRQIGPEAYL